MQLVVVSGVCGSLRITVPPLQQELERRTLTVRCHLFATDPGPPTLDVLMSLFGRQVERVQVIQHGLLGEIQSRFGDETEVESEKRKEGRKP